MFPTYVLRHGIADRDSLRAGSNGIRGILDVGAGDNGAAGQEQSAADVEVGVWAFFLVYRVSGCGRSRLCKDYVQPRECMCMWLCEQTGSYVQ